MIGKNTEQQLPIYQGSSNLNIESHVINKNNHNESNYQSQTRPKISNNLNKNVQKKVLVDIGKIQPYMK
jgi:hypothetical protein